MTKTKKIASSFLAVAVLGENTLQLLNQMTEIISSANCTVINFSATVLGEQLAAHLLISGKWNQVAKAETLLSNFGKTNTALHIKLQRTEVQRPDCTSLPYSIYAIAVDGPGIIHKLIEFFAEQSIAISEINSHTYKARTTATPMLSLTMQIQISTDLHLADLRDSFMVFCDNFNIDAIMEPDKS